jgi:hypothetical protein
MTMPSDYPGLDYLGGFFHEDWMEDAPTWERLLEFFAEHTSAEERRSALQDAHRLLAEATDDRQLEVALRQLGFMYVPEPQTYREWLVDLRDKLASTL